MRSLENVGVLLLAVWLVLAGTTGLLPALPPTLGRLVLNGLAVVAGGLLFFRTRDTKPLINVGVLLLAIWLVLHGAANLLHVGFPGMSTLLAVLALVAGAFFLPSVVGSRNFYHAGLTVLGIWLIAISALPWLGVDFSLEVKGALAILAAFLLLLGL